MYNGKMKAVTFSYDDGVTQDKRLIELFDKYNLKATFNINSGLLGKHDTLPIGKETFTHYKNDADKVKEIYKNHEVAVHTLTHPNLTELDDNEVIRQVEEDRRTLSGLVGYEVTGMAYPSGGTNNNAHVAEIIHNKTGVKYARTIASSFNFEPQDRLLQFNPSVSHNEVEQLFQLAEKFIELKPDQPKLFYIWGHSYELDVYDRWQLMEDFCKLISNRDDIFYGTNRQVLLQQK